MRPVQGGTVQGGTECRVRVCGGGCGAAFAGLGGVLRAGQAGRRRGELAGLPEGEHGRQAVDDARQGGQN